MWAVSAKSKHNITDWSRLGSNKLINVDGAGGGRHCAQFVQQTLESNTKKRRRCLSKRKTSETISRPEARPTTFDLENVPRRRFGNGDKLGGDTIALLTLLYNYQRGNWELDQFSADNVWIVRYRERRRVRLSARQLRLTCPCRCTD